MLPLPSAASSAAPTPVPTWGIRDILLGIVVYALPLLVLAFGARAVNARPPDLPPDERGIVTAVGLIVFEGLLLAPVWLLALVRARSDWRAVGFRGFDPALGCVLPFVYLFVAFLVSAAWGALLQFMNWPTQQEIGPLFGTDPLAIALGYVGTAIVAPIAEETFFRGFVIGGLRRRFGAAGALVLSAVFFALLHPPLTIFPVIFVLGLLLGLLFLQTGSLYPGMLMHAMFNTVGFLAQVFLSGNTPH